MVLIVRLLIVDHLINGQALAKSWHLEKYEQEAKEKSRETWYLSWALNTNQEEREKGKTVEIGKVYF